MRPCENCGQNQVARSFPPTKSPLFLDGRLTICKSCLNKAVVQEEGLWDLVDLICQWADVPFVAETFTKFYQTSPNEAMGLYLDTYSQQEYDRINWKEYQDKWKKCIAENQINKIHPAFNEQEVLELGEKWGNDYPAESLYRLQKFYNGLQEAYGFSDVIAESNAMKLAKLDLEIDRCIASGSAGLDKLVTAYDKIQKSSGFTSENAHDMNSFESISEIALFYEKIGWDTKYHNDEPKDIVDLTIQDIQAYNRQLWEGEPSIPDEIEAAMERKARIDAREAQRAISGDNFALEELEELYTKHAAKEAPNLDDDELNVDFEIDD